MIAVLASSRSIEAQDPRLPIGSVRIAASRFTFGVFPRDVPLARALLAESQLQDTFPGLPRPRNQVTILIAPDARRFRAWLGASAPEWGAAIAFPEESEIVMQGSRASSSAGNPGATLRHELAHLALHEAVGELPPRWFDEGCASFAAGEWSRDEVLATNFALMVRGLPSLAALDALFLGGESRAQQGYALAERAVAEMAALDRERGLALFLVYWRESSSLDLALRRAYGVTEEEFEARWKSATRRRYGGLALLADVSLAVLFLLLLVGPLWIGRRRRDRRRLTALRAADEQQDARDGASALAAFLAEEGGPPILPLDGTREPAE